MAIVIGRVVRLDAADGAAPLGYHRGRYVAVDRRTPTGPDDEVR